MALFGGRSLWLSQESSAINGWPLVQTVTQAMAELRRRTLALVTMFTAGALGQGRDGWTHRRPEIEDYIASQTKNGNVFLSCPCDGSMIQAPCEWAVNSWNKGVTIIASKSALPVYTTMAQSRRAISDGGHALRQRRFDTRAERLAFG